MWTHGKGRRSDRPRDSVGRCGRPAFVADPSASESSSSGDDAGVGAAAHEWLQEWDVPEASSDVERKGDADEPRGLGIDVEGAHVISKRDHAHAAAIAAEREDDAHAHRAWDDTRRASEDEDDVRERLLSSFLLRISRRSS